MNFCYHNTRHCRSSQALSVDPAGQVATASQKDAQPFAALARVAELRLGNFNVQGLANTAWAFATACQSDVLLFTALARAAVWHMGNFKAQALANTA